MEQEIFILSSKQWELEDENTGKVRKGTTIWYVSSLNKRVDLKEGLCGEVPAKATLDYEFHESVIAAGGAPTKGRARFVIRTRNNMQQLVIDDIVLDEAKK